MNYIVNQEEIVRHEKTAKDNDGQKLDQPTQEGLIRSYSKGEAKRSYLDSHPITLLHSNKQRTDDAAKAWGLGANPNFRIIGSTGSPVYAPIRTTHDFEEFATHYLDLSDEQRSALTIVDKHGASIIAYDPSLDSIKPDASQKAEHVKLRNMTNKDAQLDRMFELYGNQLTEKGKGMIRTLTRRAYQDAERFDRHESIKDYSHPFRHGRTHGPLSDVAALIALGEEPTVDNVRNITGRMPEGEGFSSTVKPEGNLYYVEFKIPTVGIKSVIPLELLAERASIKLDL
jgi:hypothetical protein